MLRGQGDPSAALRDVAPGILATGALDPLLDRDAAAGRLARWIEAHRTRAVDDLLARFDPAMIADPTATTSRLFLVEPATLGHVAFDHVISIGTGFEPVERNVRALSSARQRVSLLVSEHDPLA